MTEQHADSLTTVPMTHARGSVRRLDRSRFLQVAKRAFDLAAACVMLAAVVPLMIVLAVAIKRDSRGPVFSRLACVGRDGRVFLMWRLRTTVTGADAMHAQLRAQCLATAGFVNVVSDPTLSCAGRRLRRTSLDEIAQLLNVVRGEMSLVGPRPPVAGRDAEGSGDRGRRLNLTPGMTGPWQILGSSGLSSPDRAALDDAYVVGWSPWRDIRILLCTVAAVARRRWG